MSRAHDSHMSLARAQLVHGESCCRQMACFQKIPAIPANFRVLPLTQIRNKTTRVQEWKDKKRFAVKVNPEQRPVEETASSGGHKWMDVRWKNRNSAETLIHALAIDDTRRSDLKEARKISDAKFHALRSRLQAHGFCRERKAYTPPANVEQEVRSALDSVVSSKVAGDSWLSFPLTDNRIKFRFLMQCASRMNHLVPNSDLYLMKTVDDVVKFYKEPVRDVMAYDHLVRVQQRDELPDNLHVVEDVITYDPNSDFMGGIDAFPGNPDTRVHGIRDKLKYPSVKQTIPWPDI